MSDTTDWPLGETLRLPASQPRPTPARRPLPRAAWVLATAGFVAGGLVSAAAFSVGWRHQAEHGSSTAAALAAATAKNHALRASLVAARHAGTRTEAKLAAARTAKARATATATAISHDASSLASAIVANGRSADSISAGAGSIGTSVDKLAGELKTLTAYLATTPAAQLDAGYVATQTAYLSKQLDGLKAARGDLGATIASFQASAKKLADRAAKLAGSG
jgi:hypothetical protein